MDRKFEKMHKDSVGLCDSKWYTQQGVQSAGHGTHAALDSYDWGPAKNHTFLIS